MDRVLRYLESNTPTRVVDKRNGKVITDYANMDTNAQLERGTFRLASYEWGLLIRPCWLPQKLRVTKPTKICIRPFQILIGSSSLL